jgi:hypothetical protein
MRNDFRIRSARRAGQAPLEFALSLPVLLFLFGVILSTAYIGLGRLDLIHETKNQAWKARDSAHSGQPLMFMPQEKLLTKNGAKTVRILPFVQGLTVDVHAQHTLLAGAWDYHEVQPGEDPFGVAAKMGGGLATGQAQQLSNLGSLLQNALGGFLNNLLGLGDQAQAKMNELNQKKQQLQQAKEKLAQDIAATQKKIQDLQQQITKVNQQLDKLKADRDQAKKNNDNKKVQDLDNQIKAAQQQQQQLNANLKKEQDTLKKQQAGLAAGQLSL